MSDLFAEYENNFLDNLDEARRHLDEYQSASGNEAKRRALERATEKIEDADQNLQSIKDEASKKPQFREKSRTLTTQYQEIKTDLSRAKAAALNAENRASLLEGGTGAVTEKNVNSLADRDRVVQTIYRLDANAPIIDDMNRILGETEDTADDIMVDLDRQRGVLEGILDRLRDVNGNLAAARRTIRTMSYKMVQQRVLLFGIAGLLIFIIFLVIFIRFFWSSVFGSS
eukprot:TRINITY_DN372_c0_g1_i1.p1 TRINITY_DN372_c0_g1~~TRINITY_DN372_c0_g1_i1.p1  ORF type:complete len:228 (-),score=49.96 TRINITY_DN372_c0_g1_i1:58-741(-)